ncbi:hypothetical protein [Tsukamurella pseudospumae]|uniref:Lipoprotein n=1 Tax=Tsukamurella pseudospumae TaxID=239498 RepID=A0A137YTS4_9ACTN|nr:hypothetical protein [Tsukamurella pseudospumae]KXO89281.1 hypothetical protein AXK61_11800 [Tsukamurella pseudospumae]
MNHTTSIVAGATGAAILALVVGCSEAETPTEPSAPSSMVITEPSTSQSVPPSPGTVHPTRTVTVRPTGRAPTTIPKPTKSTGPGSEYDVPCTGGPGEGTICTNPNHGAGDDPYGTRTVAPTPSKPR